MSAASYDPVSVMPGAARRLARLFRIERAGRLDRRLPATAQRLIARRAALIDALIAAEHRRRADGVAPSPAVVEALRALALELGYSRPAAERRLQALAAELWLRRSAAPPSGLRGGEGGRLLGTS